MNIFDPSQLSRRQWMQFAAIAAAFPVAKAWGKAITSDDDEDEAEDDDARYKTKLDTNLIGDHTNVGGLEPVVLEGVGLVRNLAGTGGDPAPSQYRTALLDDLKKDGYKNPHSILSSPNTALVIVRAYLRPMIRKGERLDVEITVPSNANVSSLVGGELLEVRLSDKAIVDGKLMNGHTYAVARGPVLTAGLGASTVKEPALLKQGRVLSGAVVLKERDLTLNLKRDFISVRNTKRVSEAIGRRFHDFDEFGIKKTLATPKTDQKIVLKVHPSYRENPARYLQVIRHMAFTETPVELRVRMARLKHDLCIPKTANASALQLEAIGSEGIPILKHGLTSPTIECRFHSAVSLAYLGETAGLVHLVESAKKERAFRRYALDAIATMEDADAHIALKALMSEPSDETRYGAFRALWTLDKSDPFIRGEVLGMREDDERRDNEYKLYVLKTEGPPMVHVTLRTRPEIVVFGAEQEFTPPLYLSAGKHIIVTAQPGSDKVQLARFEVGKPDQRKEVSMRVADVIRAANELGATYPDALQLLADASRQKNLPTSIAVEKIPQAGRAYYRPESKDTPTDARKIRIGREVNEQNEFPGFNQSEDNEGKKSDAGGSRPSGSLASVPSVATDPADEDDGDSGDSKRKKKSGTNKKDDKSKNSWKWFGGNK